MENNFNEFLNNVTSGVIEAVRKGGYNNVYITDSLEIIVNNASKDVIEAGGTNIVYTIECMSYGDLGYENPEDFIQPDAENYCIDNLQDKLEEVFNKFSKN